MGEKKWYVYIIQNGYEFGMEGECGIHAINITICQNSTKERSHRYHYSWLHYK